MLKLEDSEANPRGRLLLFCDRDSLSVNLPSGLSEVRALDHEEVGVARSDVSLEVELEYLSARSIRHSGNTNSHTGISQLEIRRGDLVESNLLREGHLSGILVRCGGLHELGGTSLVGTVGLLLEVHVVSQAGGRGRVSLSGSGPRLRPDDSITSGLCVGGDRSRSLDEGLVTLKNLVGGLSGIFLDIRRGELSFSVVGILLESEEVSGGGGNNARNDTSGSHLNFLNKIKYNKLW